jgi:hypothetical protein
VPRRRSGQGDRRRQIAAAAARLLARQECLDIPSARRKAARQIGCRERHGLPDNHEIEQALIEYQQLFLRESQPQALKRLRGVAVEAMRQLRQFDPHLTGPVLSGSADGQSPVQLYLFAETPEEVLLYLLERRIPFEERERQMSYASGLRNRRPLFRFLAGDHAIELVVLPQEDRSNPPLRSTSEQPDRGATLERVLGLIESAQATEP